MKKIKNYTFELFSKYRPILMGIATLSVIFFHFTDDRRLYNYGFDALGGIIRLYNTYIGSSGVDIFLFLSGLGIYFSWKKNNNYYDFLKKRLPRILIPYILIAIPAYSIRDILILKLPFIEFIKDIFFISLFKSGETWHWYICFIGIMYIIFPYLFEMVESSKKNIDVEKMLLSFFASIIIFTYMLYIFANPIFGNINIMFLRIPAFLFGIYLGRLAYNKEKIENKWMAVVVLALLIIPLRSFNRTILTRTVVSMLALSQIFIIIQIFEYFEKRGIKLNFVKKVLSFFGKYSLELYLTHVTIRSFFLMRNFPTYRVKYEILMVISSIIMSFLLHFLTEKINKLNQNLGIKTNKKRSFN